MQDLIKVGDEIENCDGDKLIIKSLEYGRFGILIKDEFGDGLSGECFMPWELPPPENREKFNWYGWNSKQEITLTNGMTVGVVTLRRGDPIDTVEEYDLKWQDTVTAIIKEEGYA